MLNKVSKDDWQYLIPFSVCTICFITTDFLGIIEKSSVAYWSGRLVAEPYRIITSHFFHADINHLLVNASGIIVARYFLKELGLRSYYFLFYLITLLIPLQVFICWSIDIFFYRNPTFQAIGFSGILFGIDSFILMTTIFGKKQFLFINCEMKKNSNLFKSISLLTGLGIIWSFMPGISMQGHLSGFISGILLFLL
tara:strand:+ start:512 stop:1099 length:588 start_codon:yes stop_codon:yes gene_type:complete